jgi:hypothetical protein
MGLEVSVVCPEPPPLAEVLARLELAGLPSVVVMADSTLLLPTASPPEDWTDLRLKTPAGTVTVLRRPNQVVVVVFGNADVRLQDAQQKVAAAFAPGQP